MILRILGYRITIETPEWYRFSDTPSRALARRRYRYALQNYPDVLVSLDVAFSDGTTTLLCMERKLP